MAKNYKILQQHPLKSQTPNFTKGSQGEAVLDDHNSRKRAEYGFGEYGFKHRTQWVSLGSLSSVFELSEFLSAYYLRAKANSPSLTQNSPSSPQNSVRLSELSSLKQYSRNSIPPVS